MSLFGNATKFISDPTAIFGGGSSINLDATAEAAFLREQERLKEKKAKAREEAAFLSTEGQAVAERADVTFGDQLDLEGLTDEERLERSTGIKSQDTGLIL